MERVRFCSTTHQFDEINKEPSLILLLRDHVTQQQLEQMLEALAVYVKLAVDICLGIAAGGGVMHADCEALLLENGSRQEDIWGADWLPDSQQISFEALINRHYKETYA